MRSKKEIKGIEKKLAEIAVAKAKAEIQAKFPKPAETAQNAPGSEKRDIPA